MELMRQCWHTEPTKRPDNFRDICKTLLECIASEDTRPGSVVQGASSLKDTQNPLRQRTTANKRASLSKPAHKNDIKEMFQQETRGRHSVEVLLSEGFAEEDPGSVTMQNPMRADGEWQRTRVMTHASGPPSQSHVL